ncbi:helix-turn-helix domain-containing protein [Paraburkholderia sp. RP-4-7]|uniref:Helix-turn-helix domain-containing protein n=1 Tax=Paraburkholderia polaris TaxID=2728848 RepID=A0A848I464_9BURK|nr:helix-turn-helix domain-containing protein [Paraburkholderia polaris]NML97127.1 helix-turn-helix domain-containing protein [Paraburkholderia polaris]
MSSILSLDDMPVTKRFSYFRDVVESFYIPIGLQCDTPERFNAWVKGNSLGPVDVGTCFLAEQRVSRKVEHIARSQEDRIKLIMPISGAIAVCQDNNHAVVRPGQFYITDPTRVYEERILEDLTFTYMLIPREAIAARIGDTGKITATPLDYDQPYARLAADMVRSLVSVSSSMEGFEAQQAGAIAADLVTMALWERMDKVPTHRTAHRTAQFQQAKAMIEQNLTNGGLSLEGIATRMGLSTRYLNGLLSEGNLHYRHYVLAQRLARCKRHLTDPRLAQLAVAEIAARCGFVDSAHFSRAFKAIYGVPPREYRSAALAGVVRSDGPSARPSSDELA